MAAKKITESAKQRSKAGNTAQPNRSDYVTNILNNPETIDDQTWDVLTPPVPRTPEEKKQLNQTIKMGGADVTVYQVKKSALIELMDSKALELLVHMTPDKMEKATVQQLAIAMGVLTDKARLMRGEPTAIYRVEDSRKLDEIGKAILQEMDARGITFDGELDDAD